MYLLKLVLMNITKYKYKLKDGTTSKVQYCNSSCRTATLAHATFHEVIVVFAISFL